jgi:putative transposase
MNLTLMRLIDEQFPRGTVVWLAPDDAPSSPAGLQCGPQADPPLMHKMGLAPIFKKPKTSKPCPEHKVYPYLLKDLVIDRPNRVWCADVTYIQIKRGFLYLVAVMDWASRKVLSWRLSNTMDTDFCVAALEEAIACYGVPEIFRSRASPSPMC